MGRQGLRVKEGSAVVALAMTGLLFGCVSHQAAARGHVPRVRAAIAIAGAHAFDRRLFRIFPNRIGVRRCSIPEGGLRLRGRHIAGICATRVRIGVRALVSFTEVWPRGCRLTRPHAGRCRFHTWQIVVGRGGRILGERNLGDPAPQF
jgi:hypothetical protein